MVLNRIIGLPPSENKKHSYTELGRKIVTNKGENNGNSKLIEKQVIEIKKLLEEGKLPQKEIAKMFNINHRVISNIKRNILWRHL